MAQQKQRKQLILTDNQNISAYHFQPIQRLQPNFITDDIKNFMALLLLATWRGGEEPVYVITRHHRSWL